MKFKIITVSGCSNCPYLKVWNDGEKKVSGSCSHYSWNKELGEPYMDIKELQREYKGGVMVNNPVGIPEWCPLD